MAGDVIKLVDSRVPLATKGRILDAAEALFLEHGFEATSLRAITRLLSPPAVPWTSSPLTSVPKLLPSEHRSILQSMTLTLTSVMGPGSPNNMTSA